MHSSSKAFRNDRSGMKVLVGHNHYIFKGGEDAAAASEVDLLRRHGHDVVFWEMTNNDFNAFSPLAKLRHVFSWDWSRASYDQLRKTLRKFRPDIAHFHNTFFMMTPSVYDACRDEGVPIVQTLHNFRMLCANALLFRKGFPCEECMDHGLRRGIRYGCYHDSRILTWAIVRMLDRHWRQQTWQKKVDAFIVTSDFAYSRYVKQGLPVERFFVKPNFLVTDPGERQRDEGYAFYGGRLSEEKGVRTLLHAWLRLKGIPLVIAGTGPLEEELRAMAARDPSAQISFTGFLEKEEYLHKLRGARCVIIPSECYENFPVTMVEAFACGIPVVGSRIGSLEGLIKDESNGLLFSPRSPEGLAFQVNRLFFDEGLAARLGQEARRSFQALYMAEQNHDRLTEIYRYAIGRKRG
ncbi:MAG: glycosyltransferase family 4 protein [Candidatus Omnitrophica bacterium]|nr:glycosyltransferase family 4 protein [Candidatus Omnitrophota bacterium]